MQIYIIFATPTSVLGLFFRVRPADAATYPIFSQTINNVISTMCVIYELQN